MKGELINKTRAWDKEKNPWQKSTHEIPNTGRPCFGCYVLGVTRVNENNSCKWCAFFIQDRISQKYYYFYSAQIIVRVWSFHSEVIFQVVTKTIYKAEILTT